MTSTPSLAVWLFVLGAGMLLSFFALRRRGETKGGFIEFIKSPAYREHLGKAHQQADDAVQQAKAWDQTKIDSATRHFILEVASSCEAWQQARILRELGDRTHPTIHRLLGDRCLYDRLVKPTGNNLLPEAPFHRASDLLGDSPSREVVPLIASFLNDPSKSIRQHAALVIAKTGGIEIVPYMQRALAAPDGGVQSYALMGLQFALKRNGLHDGVRAKLFPDVKHILEHVQDARQAADVLLPFQKAAEVLLGLDQERAREFFLSQRVFSIESPILIPILTALARAKVAVPPEILRPLIAALESKDEKNLRALGEALRLLGQTGLPEDREFLKARTMHAEERVAKRAAEGLLRSYGLDGAIQRILEAQRKTNYVSLPEPQRYFIAVFMCDAEINNGGLAQYFVNSTGDHWRDAVAGLEVMGSTERLAILREAIALFGDAGPSEDHKTRQNQLSRVYKKKETAFKALDRRYYASKEVVEVFTSAFILEHRASFK